MDPRVTILAGGTFRDDAAMVGAIYDEFGRQYHRSRREAKGRFANEYIDVPAVMSLLPDELSGLRVLDAGCGSGIYAQLIAAKGAAVVGVDASATMIDIAEREKPAGVGIEYQVGDIGALPFDDHTFDVIVCAYVLENVGDLGRVFGEFRRVLRNDAVCVFSISHPVRAYAEKQQREGDETWTLRTYLEPSTRRSDFGNGMIVPKYVRPLSYYTEAVASAGFAIVRLIEPRPVPAAAAVDPKSYATASQLPQLLAARIGPIT